MHFQTRDFLSFFLCKSVKHVGPGRGHFWPHGYNLNNLGRGPLDEAIKGSGLLVSGKKIFEGFLYISYVKHVDPKQGHFWPLGNNLNNLGRSPLDKAIKAI